MNNKQKRKRKRPPCFGKHKLKCNNHNKEYARRYGDSYVYDDSLHDFEVRNVPHMESSIYEIACAKCGGHYMRFRLGKDGRNEWKFETAKVKYGR